MIESHILRRKIERFRRMRDDETDQSTRRAIESMIREFESMLSISELGKLPAGEDQRSEDDNGKGR